MTSHPICLSILFLGLFALPLSAAEDQQETGSPAVNSGQTDTITENEIEPGEDSAEQTSELPRPQGANLRERDIGDAFKNFQPSEEISADNAVTFPVDI